MPPYSEGNDGERKEEATRSPPLLLEAVANKDDDEGKHEAESKTQEDLEIYPFVDPVRDHQFS